VAAPLYSQSLNRYSYALNSPMTLTDPTGHCGVGQEGSPSGGKDCGGSGFIYSDAQLMQIYGCMYMGGCSANMFTPAGGDCPCGGYGSPVSFTSDGSWEGKKGGSADNFAAAISGGSILGTGVPSAMTGQVVAQNSTPMTDANGGIEIVDVTAQRMRATLADFRTNPYFANDISTLSYAVDQYQKAFGPIDLRSPNTHIYQVGPIVICNNGPKCGMNAALHCNVPTGCSAFALQTGDVVFAGPGWVSVNVDLANHEITNITTWAHALYPGVVSIDVLQNGNTGSVIFTGIGTGAMAETNDYFAGPVWSITAALMGLYAY